MSGKKYNPEVYKNIGIDQLVVFSVSSIEDQGEECTFERLVNECFTFFPGVFGFLRYPQWPDSARINKSWLRCRTDKGWISGSTKEGFRITPLGANIAKEIAKTLGSKLDLTKKKSITRSREKYEAIIRFINNSLVFQKYNNQKLDKISESDLVTFLGGTLETPKRILIGNLNLYYHAVNVYEKKELLPFLNLCKSMLSNFRE
jgi:hypothetical protein